MKCTKNSFLLNINHHIMKLHNRGHTVVQAILNCVILSPRFQILLVFDSYWKEIIFLILSPFYSLCFLIPSQYFSTVSRHFSTIFNYCECIFPWNYFSVKKNPIFFTETSECIFPWNYFSNFYRFWISTIYKCLGLREFSREVLSTY